MSEDNKSIEEIIAISYFDTDNIDIKKHTERYFEIRRNIVDVLNKYNIMWTVTDTNGFNNKDKEIERLNNIINELNNAYCKVITKCEEMIDNRFYMNDNAIKKYADEIKDICKYYVGEAKELKGSDKECLQ